MIFLLLMHQRCQFYSWTAEAQRNQLSKTNNWDIFVRKVACYWKELMISLTSKSNCYWSWKAVWFQNTLSMIDESKKWHIPLLYNSNRNIPPRHWETVQDEKQSNQNQLFILLNYLLTVLTLLQSKGFFQISTVSLKTNMKTKWWKMPKMM